MRGMKKQTKDKLLNIIRRLQKIDHALFDCGIVMGGRGAEKRAKLGFGVSARTLRRDISLLGELGQDTVDRQNDWDFGGRLIKYAKGQRPLFVATEDNPLGSFNEQA